MSEIDKLLLKCCPDGVEWHPFFSVCDLIRGITYNKEQETKTLTNDAHKVLRANNITLHLNALNFEDVKLVSKDVVVKPAQHLFAGDILMCAGSGSREHVGKVAYIPENMDYTFGGFMAVVRCKEAILPRFVYHILTSGYFSNHLDVQINSSTINNINKQVMQSFELPVPPLPVQEEIVRVLDTFTKLQAELQAELQTRLQQYNYYRDNLLSFEGREDVEWKRIGDICTVFTGGEVPDGSIKGDTPQGDMKYPIWGNGKEVYGFARTYQIVQDAVCVSSIGANTGAVYFHTAFFTPIIRLKVLIPNDNGLLTRYLFHVLSVIGFDVKKSSVPNMNSNEVKQKIIPVPSLAEQQMIVDILDRFDTLTNDLSQGLPAEIEARRKQYEFYRDKLLTFKRKEA